MCKSPSAAFVAQFAPVKSWHQLKACVLTSRSSCTVLGFCYLLVWGCIADLSMVPRLRRGRLAGRALRTPFYLARSILDFSRRLTIVIKRPCCELVYEEWLTTARGHTVASCDERGLARAAHTDVVYIHICGHVSAGSGHGFRIFPWPNNRCCSGANGRLPSRHWHPSQQ